MWPLTGNYSKGRGWPVKTQSKQQRGLCFCILAHSLIYVGSWGALQGGVRRAGT